MRNIFQPIGSSPLADDIRRILFAYLFSSSAIISRIGREFVRAVVGRGGRRRGEAQRNGKELCAYDIALQANEREFLAHETSPSRNISPPISTAACRPSLYTCSKVCAIRPLNRKRYKILGGEYVVAVTGDL